MKKPPKRGPTLPWPKIFSEAQVDWFSIKREWRNFQPTGLLIFKNNHPSGSG
jgi:hypothetical protein